MILLSALELTLPLKNPVLIFSLILFIILFAPLLLNKLKIPHLVGLIIAGAIIGPNGLNFMLRDSSIVLFGTVGLLYIMFLAGLEIDLAEFRKNSKKSLVFGLYTFLVPMTLGTVAGLYALEMSWNSSLLLASMFASHTLIVYPMISKMGVTKNRAVNVAVGGTLITDTLALLVLAAIVGISTGEVTNAFWLRLSISVMVFALIVSLLFPVIGRWFFKRFPDNVSQYIFVLAMVFLGSFLAEAAGIEAIIGAFLVGLVLNRLIPHTSPLMNRIEFVGNAIFIPFFLIGVGMLIDYRAFIQDFETIKVAVLMTVIATVAKFTAAWLTQKTYNFSVDERRLIFGLSNAQAAATLAAVLVGYNVILGETPDGEPIRLLGDSILNGSILMILVTCTMASFVAQKGAKNISLKEVAEPDGENHENHEKILIPISNIESTEELVNLGLTIKSPKNKESLYALSIVENNVESEPADDASAKKILDKAVVYASSTDNLLKGLLRYDLNIVNGITSVVKENKISDLILGLHVKKGLSDSFLGNLTEGILTQCNTTTLIYKPVQPLSTIKRHLVIVPDKAEKEIGFPFWISKIWNIARNTGAKIKFYGTKETLAYISAIHSSHPIDCVLEEFDEWSDFLILARDISANDNLIVIMSRKDRPSYEKNMARIPLYLNKYFQKSSFILIFPMQTGVDESMMIDKKSPSFLEPIERLDDIGKTIAAIFKKK